MDDKLLILRAFSTLNQVRDAKVPELNLLPGFHELVEDLRARLSAPEPEPVAWTVSGLITDFSRDFSAYQTKTYTRPLYTAPQRKFVELTIKEIEDAYMSGTGFVLARENNIQQHLSRYDNVCFARAIEKTLREKSNG